MVDLLADLSGREHSTRTEGVEHSQIRLLAGGQELRGEVTLAELGVQSGGTLTLVLVPPARIVTCSIDG